MPEPVTDERLAEGARLARGGLLETPLHHLEVAADSQNPAADLEPLQAKLEQLTSGASRGGSRTGDFIHDI